jgi:Ca2+-transporting ATPase
MYENKTIADSLKDLNTSSDGLTIDEVKARQAKYGPNKLLEKKRESALIIFLIQFRDPMVIILFGAAIISLILGILHPATGTYSIEDSADVIIIFGVVILNATIGTIQETKAEKALDALKKLSSPTATVRRQNQIADVKAEEVVVGDIVILEEGRTVPADLRLTKAFAMKCDESSLTGESVPVEKNPAIVFTDEVGVGDRVNVAYMSTPVVYGRGEGAVIGTGMNTEIGRIAKMLSGEGEEQTPLQKKLEQLSKFLGYLTIAIVVMMLGVSFIYDAVRNTFVAEWSNDLLDAVGLAVAAIPEGLPAVVTIVLAMGMQKMIKVNTIVRRLASVETLGAVSVVCSDKTGTLTQNKMTVVEAYENGVAYEKADFKKENLDLLGEGMALCNDASIENGVYGDPTELALIYFASDGLGMAKSQLENDQPRQDELPFDAVRKMMSTRNLKNGKSIIFTKGALDRILKKCTTVLINGEAVPLTDDGLKQINDAATAMASKALRVLALAYKESDVLKEEDLVFVGFVGMVDPPRPAAKPAVETFKEAGITTIMITGDHKDTAYAIATELGIASSLDQVMSGDQIDACTPEELKEKVKTIRVFARVSPENKVQIVKAVKANGEIAAMTGDGVNDAPSLKAADIGIAMGITGTDVAKGASDMVLTDDNFASIEKAVEEGRGIYANIRKTILFLISSNIGEVICMFLAIAIGLPAPLIAIHLLWVNLITDSLPAVALGADKKPANIMKDKPRDSKESLFAHGGYALIFGYGTLIGVVTLVAFLFDPWRNGCVGIGAIETYFSNSVKLEESRSMAFCVLSFAELFHMLGMTDTKRSFVHVFHDPNALLWTAFFVGMALQIGVIVVPGLNSFFSVYEMDWVEWLFVFAMAITPLILHEIVVFVQCIKARQAKKKAS